jgi:hypothetical protein
MNLIYFYIINIFTYFILLKIFFVIFKFKYKFPFRYADIAALIFNIIIFVSFSYFIFGINIAFATILINFNIFYIFFHLINMIITSPRTKIILDLIHIKTNQLNIRKYKYDYKIIVKNRLRRLKTNKQLIFRKNEYILKDKDFNFFSLVGLVFKMIEKF